MVQRLAYGWQLALSPQLAAPPESAAAQQPDHPRRPLVSPPLHPSSQTELGYSATAAAARPCCSEAASPHSRRARLTDDSPSRLCTASICSSCIFSGTGLVGTAVSLPAAGDASGIECSGEQAPRPGAAAGLGAAGPQTLLRAALPALHAGQPTLHAAAPGTSMRARGEGGQPWGGTRAPRWDARTQPLLRHRRRPHPQSTLHSRPAEGAEASRLRAGGI